MQPLCLSAWGGEARMEVVTTQDWGQKRESWATSHARRPDGAGLLLSCPLVLGRAELNPCSVAISGNGT